MVLSHQGIFIQTLLPCLENKETVMGVVKLVECTNQHKEFFGQATMDLLTDNQLVCIPSKANDAADHFQQKIAVFTSTVLTTVSGEKLKVFFLH